MKTAIGIIGSILAWLTVILFLFDGLIILNGVMGVAGVIIGVCVFPIAMLIGLATIFTSWSAFIGTVVWFSLIALMINYGDIN